MNKNENWWEQFTSWVNGDREEVESRLFSIAHAPREEKPVEEEPPKPEERQRLQGFLGWYSIAATIIGLTIIGVLIATVLVLPPFGHADNPTNNELPARYLEKTREETGASNAVAGLILNYRGFDTFGESCVLFLAVSSVFMLLREEKGASPRELRRTTRAERQWSKQRDIILQAVAGLLVPIVLLFGLYMLLGGHHAPGGAFSGGAVLGGALILYTSAFGHEAVRKFFNERVYHVMRVTGLLLYAVLFAYYIFMGANGLDNHIPLDWGGLILPIDIAVGMVVACTIYGFYAMFTRGEL